MWQIADKEQRTITQICERLLREGVEAYKKEGAKFMQRLVASRRLGSKMHEPATGALLPVTARHESLSSEK